MPTSKLTLVRVDGFWNIMPSVFPRKSGRALPLFCSRFSLLASVRIVLISLALRSATLSTSFLLEEVFNVFICQVYYLVFLLASVFIFFALLLLFLFFLRPLLLFLLQPSLLFFFLLPLLLAPALLVFL